MDLIELFKKNGKRLLSGEKPALLAVSGGIDSMVMAQLFLDAELPFAIAHCNFGLRGSESDGDETFVREWCLKNNIDCFVTHFDTQKEAEAQGTGIQETARNLRYKWFEDIRATHHFTAICTAHHADDNAETMLMNLCRGTGIAGLHGIPEKNGLICRPLLFATRKKIKEYADAHNISYHEDSSNNSDDYLRNTIRHHILPVLEEWIPGTVQNILRTSKQISEAEEIYLKTIDKERKKLLQPRGKDFYIPVKLLKHRKPLNAICYELLRPFGFTPLQIPFVVEDLLYAESGKYIASPTHRLIRNRDFLIITEAKAQNADIIFIEDLKHDITTADGTFYFSVRNGSSVNPETEKDTALIDAGKLEKPVLLRRWKTGDYFYPLGMGMKKKKLSRFFVDQKLSIHQKEKIWVLESNKRIVWVAGLRTDERFKISPATQDVLKIKFTPL
jgi:tRNA(Ile)-lysidine synthase